MADEPVPMLVLEWIAAGGQRPTRRRSVGRSPRCTTPGRPRSAGRTAAPPAAGRCPTTRSRRGRRSTRRTGCCRWPGWRATGGRCRRRRSSPWSGWPGRWSASTTAPRRRACTATCGPATGWSTRDGASWLIDPAAHGGHREFDLAMMRLFGGFGPACFAAYAEVHPLDRRLGRPGRAAPDRPAGRARDQVRRRLRVPRPSGRSPATPDVTGQALSVRRGQCGPVPTIGSAAARLASRPDRSGESARSCRS